MKHDGEPHTLAAAYALDALGTEEHEAFLAHLERCASCTAEVSGFSATAARLAAAVGVPAPAHMKQAVMDRVDTVRQLPPQFRSARSVRLGTVLMRKAGPFAVAASLVTAVAFGAIAVRQHQQAEQARTQAQQADRQVRVLTGVMTAPDARTVHGRTSTGASTSVVTSARLGQAVFLSSGLPPAAAGQTYQLWFDDRGTMRPAGLLQQDGALLMQGAPGRARAVGLTLEPAGGSPRPTTRPLMLLNLPT
ncbi:anti-sigma factor [Streptomyces sp. NPDC048255]|uniref:anti-sigma factor n=1 Tax=Streptomyces sp. NPDC048255 TaxID=3154713 RepID=UPI0033D7592B